MIAITVDYGCEKKINVVNYSLRTVRKLLFTINLPSVSNVKLCLALACKFGVPYLLSALQTSQP